MTNETMNAPADTLTLDASPVTEMVLAAKDGTVALWTDERKNDFVRTFQDRARVARYIILATAAEVASTATRRKFISPKHLRTLREAPSPRQNYNTDHEVWRFARQDALHDLDTNQSNLTRYLNTIGGRSLIDLEAIAKERAQAMLKALPPLQRAVEIIDPDTAKLIDQKDKLKAQGQAAVDALEAIEPIILKDVDPKMSVGALRKLIKDTDSKRRKLVARLDAIGKEGSELEETIAKRLYAGLPGLSDAIMGIIHEHVDREVALETMTRRVEEQVKFGDSEAALELLKGFEKDELTIASEVAEKFKAALDALKLSVKKGAAKAKAKLAAGKRGSK